MRGYNYFEKLILLHILRHAGPDPGEDIRDSWRSKLETVSADLFLINRLSWNGKRPPSSSPDCPGIELVNCSSSCNKQNHSDSSCESAYKNLKLKRMWVFEIMNPVSSQHRIYTAQYIMFRQNMIFRELHPVQCELFWDFTNSWGLRLTNTREKSLEHRAEICLQGHKCKY